jgi:c-di-GMP-related signal transduction protein
MSRLTKEQKVAYELMAELDSISLDLDQVGKYIGRQDNLTYNRLIIIAESAQEEKQRQQEVHQSLLF